MLKILHIIPRLSNAGPTRTLMVVVKTLASMNLEIEHSLISLDSGIHPIVALKVKQAGIKILSKLDHINTRKEIEAADIVQLHFWNNPAVYEFLASDWGDMRLLFWFKIFGNHAPQVITQDLVNCADYCLVSSADSLNLPCFNALSPHIKETKSNFALSPADLSRLQGFKPQSHEGFNVGYIGTANFTKIHPRFIQMSAGVKIDPIKFIVCGGNDQDLIKLAESLQVSERFDFRGYVDKIQDVLRILDVFGYPLCQDTYATSEQALQEAMYGGIPPVVFSYGGIASLVKDGVTGLVVNSETEYIEGIERLFYEPQLRQQLGNQARNYAQEYFQPIKTAETIYQAYSQLMAQPKNPYRGLSKKLTTPSQVFASSLGEKGEPFWVSLHSSEISQVENAHKIIANASDVFSSGEGGIFQYRNSYPDDAYLRLWTGLVLAAKEKQQQAHREFKAALDLGCNPLIVPKII